MAARRHNACCALLAAAAILAAGCERQSDAGDQQVRPGVRFIPAESREVTDYAYYDGRTAAEQSVEIKAQVTGYLQSVDFVAGAEVTKNQQLFKIDPRPYQAAYDALMGQVALSKAQLELAQADLKRANELAKTPGAISQQEVDTRVAEQKARSAAVSAAEANSESAKDNLEYTSVTSPIDGVVDRNLLTVGNLVNKDVTLLTTVVSQTPIYVYFDVDENTFLHMEKLVREGKVQVRHRGDLAPVDMGLADQGIEYPIHGGVNFVSNQLNPGTGTIQVRGQFDNPKLVTKGEGEGATGNHRLMRPGLFVRVRLPLGPPYKALVVPQAAIGTDQGLKYVLVVNDKDTIEYRPVTLGAEQSDGWQVAVPEKMVRAKEGWRPLEPGETTSEPTIDSLSANDRVVVGGLQNVKPGVTVNAKPLAPGESMTIPTTAGPGPTPAELAHPFSKVSEKESATKPPQAPTH